MVAGQAPTYIPALDGIRFCAMTLVYIQHAGAPQVIPGRFGVTIFFFLSGYLITTLLRREFQETGTISFRHFYLRRFLRIFPPMWAVLALAGILAAFGVMNAPEPAALAAMLVNVTNYFMIFSEGVPYELGPFWSLGVEEHYYLLFPVAYLLLLNRGISPRNQALILVGVAMLLLVWRAVLQSSGVHYERVQLASDTRMDSLLWGAIMAIVINPVMDRPRTFQFVPGLAIVGIAGLILFATFQILYEPGGALFALTFTIQGLALIPIFYIGIMHHDWPVFRWLDWRPVRYLGTISYTMYLVHMPLLALFDSLAPGVDMVVRGVLVFGATAGVAHLSYVAMERPLARLRRRLHARGTAPPVTPPETSSMAEPRRRRVAREVGPGGG